MIEMRAYCPGDEDKILDLFFLCNGRPLSMPAWLWRFRDNPAGKGIIELCWDGDVLAAHFAATLYVMQIDGNECLVAQGNAGMTHPDYRGRKLFPALLRKVYERVKQSGAVMVYGCPNRSSHRISARDLGRRDIYEIPTFRLPLTEWPLPPNPGDNVVELTRFDTHFDRLWERVCLSYPVITKRDATYLTWRYIQNAIPYRILAYLDSGEALGYAVLKRYREELHIVDMLALDDHKGERLIWRAAHVAHEVGASALSLWLGVTEPLHWALERLGFRNEEPVTYFSALTLQPDFEDASVYDFHNWYLTMGDSDVY